ncbi:MAG: site-specific DNA-methyltransferase [Euryarchaeota archaeon]|nr:site-specific DNA-methyltransferase [Euryarchaeota archaeon]
MGRQQTLQYSRPTDHNAIAEDNKIRPEDLPVHRWYRFVLSYPPHLVRLYLEKFKVRPGDLVYDPFCGTGTTLVECKKNGIRSVGTEANPVAHFASRVKTSWEVSPKGLQRHANVVARMTTDALIEDGLVPEGEFRATSVKTEKLLKLPPDAEKLILTNSISPVPLHRAMRLIETIEDLRNDQYYEHERLAFASAVVNHASNLHFGPEVGVRGQKDDSPVTKHWQAAIQAMTSDLRAVKSGSTAVSECFPSDARTLDVLDDASVDAVITSPPYPNEKDYTRTTRLESVFLGFMSNRADLRALKQGLLASNTRNVYKSDQHDRLISHIPEICDLADKIESKRVELGKTSGFEKMYPRVTRLYFGGMAKHLLELSQKMRPGGRLAYVVGDQASYFRIKIPTGQLLAIVAKDLGYNVEGIDLFRTRFSTVTRERLNEEAVILSWK